MPTDAASAPRAPAAPPAVEPRQALPKSRRGLKVFGVVAAILAVFVVITGILNRRHQTAATNTWTNSEAIPAVSIVHPASRTDARSLSLPGQLQAWYNAPIYSRVSGYVQAWYYDIGARVKKGQLLAVIDTPETDQQIVQARADVATAQANLNLAKTTSERWARLLKQDAVSAQENDEKAGDYAARVAQLKAAQANLDRYLALKAFSRITAPFDGVITARKTDIGALVNAGSASPGSELFDVAEVDKLRLYVSVPQVDSAELRPGVSAKLSVPELPGQTFPARLDTTADAIAGSTGTLLSELVVNNSSGVLKPGAFAQVDFDMPDQAAGGSASASLTLPSSAILFRNKDTEVAVLGADNHVRLQHVSIERDLGPTVEIAPGLSPSAQVVNNPPDSISDGQLVRVMDGTAGR